MIRLAFLLPHFRPGGAERVVLNWIGALDRARFEPVLMLGRVDGAFLDQLPADVPVIALGGGRALTRPLRIARALKTHRIDLAYSATSAMNLAALAAPTRVARITSEHTPPGAYLREAKWRGVRAFATRVLARRAAAVAVPTRAIAEELGGGAHIHVVPNPVLAHVPATLPDRAPQTGRIVAAGRLVPAKGFDTLIAAAALLRDRGIAFRLDILGDGPLHADLARQIASAGLERHVSLLGHTDPLAPHLAAADLVVSSSRREGFGNVLVEAMAAGTPVLATRAGGPETFIADGTNGFLVPQDDAAALADAIAALLACPARRDSVRQAALTTVRAFTIDASTRRFAALAVGVLNTRLRVKLRVPAIDGSQDHKG